MSESGGGSSGLRVDPTITVGSILGLLPVFAMAFAVIWWIVGYASKVDENARRLEQLQIEMREEFKELKGEQIKAMAQQLTDLPELKAHVAANEKTITELRAANVELNNRINAMSQQVNERIDSASRMAGQAVDVIRNMYQPDVPVRRTR